MHTTLQIKITRPRVFCFVYLVGVRRMYYCKHKLINITKACVKDFVRPRMTSPSVNFIQRLNKVSNIMEWKVVEEDYDYNQEIATSSYADMLHDDERNKKFGAALEKAIKKMHNAGKKAHVLDIGTGTGLLSMLAVKYGADSIVACEAFLPMAKCAVNIIEQNHYHDKIKVIKKHSTAVTVGVDGDMEFKANILVSEVFDTELIGEGAIKTFNHAHQYLLEKDCIVIPHSGTVYAQVVESDLAQIWNKLQDWTEAGLEVPDAIKSCSGAAAVHDIQLSQFPQHEFTSLSSVLPVFQFDWSGIKKIELKEKCESKFAAVADGRAQAVFMWWDLSMDPEGEIILSCAPVWEHPDSIAGCGASSGNPAMGIPWRDHWMQAVYFLKHCRALSKGEECILGSYHDEFSLWFEVASQGKPLADMEATRPVCDCGFHFMQSRTRIGAMNDVRRRNLFSNAIKNLMTDSPVVLALGDTSLMPLAAAKLGAHHVYVVDQSPLNHNITDTIVKFNKLEGKVSRVSEISEVVKDSTWARDRTVVVLSEPFFRNAIVPWDNIHVWYQAQHVSELVRAAGGTGVKVCPQRCILRACAVQFDDLWKISSRLGVCEGLDMTLFDKLIETAKRKAESYTEAQPLWEYPGVALTTPATLFQLDLTQPVPDSTVYARGSWTFGDHARCDGVALWLEYDLSQQSRVSCGPIKDVVVNEYIAWDRFERQGVHLFRTTPSVTRGDSLRYEAEFDPSTGEFNFNFNFTS